MSQLNALFKTHTCNPARPPADSSKDTVTESVRSLHHLRGHRTPLNKLLELHAAEPLENCVFLKSLTGKILTEQ